MTHHARQAKIDKRESRRRVVQSNMHAFHKLTVRVKELEKELNDIYNQNCTLMDKLITHQTIQWLGESLIGNMKQQVLLAKVQLRIYVMC